MKYMYIHMYKCAYMSCGFTLEKSEDACVVNDCINVFFLHYNLGQFYYIFYYNNFVHF